MFANYLLRSGFIRDSWLQRSAPAFCSNMLSWLKYFRKIQPHSHSQKGKEYFHSLFRWSSSSLILQQNSTSGNCLKVSCNMKSETKSVNLLYSFTFKSTGLLCPLNGSFMHACFVKLCISPLENWLTRLWRSSHFIRYYQKITFVCIAANLKKVFAYWETVNVTVANTSFSKF